MEEYGFERSTVGGPVLPSCPSARKISTFLEQKNTQARIISTSVRETSDLLEQMNTPARKISDPQEQKNTSAGKRRREGVHIFRGKTRKLERSAGDEVWKDLGEAEEKSKTVICGGSFQNLAFPSSEARNFKKGEEDSMQIMDNTSSHTLLSPAEEKIKEEEEKKDSVEEEEEEVQAVHERKSVKADEEPEIGLNRFHILSTAITEHLKFELYLVQNL